MEIDMVAPVIAPVILEEKIGATLTLRHCQEEELLDLLDGTGAELFTLYQSTCSYVYFVYRRKPLVEYLRKNKVLLKEVGYMPENLEECLHLLAQRMSKSIDLKEAFPHELGYFLGFPKDDILAYLNLGAKECIYSGYWLVYSNLDQAKETFCRYDMAREYVAYKVRQGLSLAQIKSQFIYGGRNYGSH